MSRMQHSLAILLSTLSMGLVACAGQDTGGSGMALGGGSAPYLAGAGGVGGGALAGTGAFAGAGGTAGPLTTAGAGGAAAGLGAGAGAVAGMAGLPGSAGVGGDSGLAGTDGSAGIDATAGGGAGLAAGSDGTAGAAGMDAAGVGGTAGAGGSVGTGTCCADGDCLCHGPDPSQLTSSDGPFNVESYRVTLGTVYYPTDAEPPLAAIAICPGFLNSGPEMAPWGPFYASHGFVLIAADTLGSDFPDIRATKLLAAIDALKAENENSSSPIYGTLSGRFGTSGYSMGGGGTTIASGQDSTLRTSIGLAAWGPVTTGVSVPTLLLCGEADTVAPCNMTQSAYTGLPNTTPKMMVSIPGTTHFNWFGPKDAGGGTSGSYALAFQKVFLEGDERWKPLLLQPPSGGSQTTNIQ